MNAGFASNAESELDRALRDAKSKQLHAKTPRNALAARQ